jgi:GLPGLI family protein
MKKLTIIPFLLIISTFAFSQATEGKITYKYTIFWDKIYAKLDFLSQSEKDRIKLTRNNEEGYTTNMPLFFSSTASLYTYSEESENESTYSWRKDDYLIYRDFGEKKVKELQEMLGKTYLIEDELNPYKWRVMNELKEIQGHLCIKAITEDTVKKQIIAAWFAADIPIPVGPERLYGLPEAILGVEINGGDVLIEADKIDIRSVAEELKLPRKMKGKEINIETYQSLIQEHIKNSKVSQRSPFGAMRF